VNEGIGDDAATAASLDQARRLLQA
jgi:hypothetical protein